MDYVNVLEETLLQTGHPMIQELKDQLHPYAERLHFLLWGKTTKYVGPLADGYQPSEWISISLLLSDWLVEMISEARVNEDEVKSVVMELRNDPESVAAFAIEFLTKLIEQDVIKTANKNEVLLFLQNQLVLNMLLNHVDDLFNLAEYTITSSCGWCNKSQKELRKTSEEDGRYAYQANRRLHILKPKK